MGNPPLTEFCFLLGNGAKTVDSEFFFLSLFLALLLLLFSPNFNKSKMYSGIAGHRYVCKVNKNKLFRASTL